MNFLKLFVKVWRVESGGGGSSVEVGRAPSKVALKLFLGLFRTHFHPSASSNWKTRIVKKNNFVILADLQCFCSKGCRGDTDFPRMDNGDPTLPTFTGLLWPTFEEGYREVGFVPF